MISTSVKADAGLGRDDLATSVRAQELLKVAGVSTCHLCSQWPG
jgi:hypothetical protein